MKQQISSEAGAAAGGLRAWLSNAALPLWASAGFDRSLGAFHERLDGSGRPRLDLARRAMVQARQIYVFSHAARLGWFEEGADLAESAAEALVGRYCDAGGPRGGFAFSIGPEGHVASSVRDAYAHAFVLFALASLYRLNGDARLIVYADETIAFIDEALTDRNFGGLYDASPVTDRSKRQNPHMHLLEAYLALETAAPGRGYLDRARKIVDLFKKRLFLAEPGVLLEYFGEDWSVPEDPARCGIFEPGHHYEWVWLLAEFEALAGDDLGAEIARLYRVARQVGHAPNGLIFDELDVEMKVTKGAHRVWPHTEAVKAAVAMRAKGDAGAEAFAAAMIGALRGSFLDRPFAGGWIDHFRADGVPLSGDAPASSLYHVFLAATEASFAFEPKIGA
ncbi:mannose-6-phosphate isomerase [Methylocella silvestris]|uniref:Mannose-6-phosphate isomerase n=2 Tax=Methylocella silvestris TaxID=199596 RepID=A0A2J7TGT3_METSI|nr:mannose-6-phosphate isomerase [Methylocella silvestris]